MSVWTDAHTVLSSFLYIFMIGKLENWSHSEKGLLIYFILKNVSQFYAVLYLNSFPV